MHRGYAAWASTAGERCGYTLRASAAITPPEPVLRAIPHAAKMRFCNFLLLGSKNPLQMCGFAPRQEHRPSKSRLAIFHDLGRRRSAQVAVCLRRLSTVQNRPFATDFRSGINQNYKIALLQHLMLAFGGRSAFAKGHLACGTCRPRIKGPVDPPRLVRDAGTSALQLAWSTRTSALQLA